ncbi:MAG TPA: hypothetical protein VNQ52_04860 [Microbacteriaceae bacterium]|nr:hypothetical protein [Microbacteriaceae bacterium]
MNTATRSDAIREALVGHVAAALARPRRALWATGLVLAGAVAGAGASTATVAATGGFAVQQPAVPSGQPIPDLGPAIPAPPGTIPGVPVVAVLGEPTTLTVADATEIPLADRPEAATHLRVTVTALTPGSLSWGTDPGGNNPSGIWRDSDIGTRSATAWGDRPLDATTTTLYLTPSAGFTGTVTLQYVTHIPTKLGVNARGETFGAEGGPDGMPDLIAVVGEAPDGSLVTGYARASDLHTDSPDHPGMPSSPEEALQWQQERQEKYPNGWDIPVFDSDGTTQVGVFHIGS